MAVDTSDVGAKVRFMRRYNIGNYSHIELEMELSAPYGKLVENPDLAKSLIVTSTKMGEAMDEVLQQAVANYKAKFGIVE